MKTKIFFLGNLVSVLVLVVSFSHSNELPFRHQIIESDGLNNPWAKILCDVNNDSKLDVVIGAQKGPLVWFENPSWKRRLITKGGYDTVDGEPGDIDGDGDMDIVMGGLFWYENPGAASVSSAKDWTAHQIAVHPTHDIELGDLDNDGELDIVTRDQSAFAADKGNRVFVWKQNNLKWTKTQLDCSSGEGIALTDIDRDNDLDIVINGQWFENQGKQWKKHSYANWHPNSTVEAADINKDGITDVVLSPAELKNNHYRLSWFEVPKDPANDNWVEHIIVKQIECVIHGLQVADINNDGAIDVVYSEMHQGADPDEVVVMINQASGSKWKKGVVSTKGSHYIQIGDIDGDGDIDLMGANWSGPYQPIELWLNELNQ